MILSYFTATKGAFKVHSGFNFFRNTNPVVMSCSLGSSEMWDAFLLSMDAAGTLFKKGLGCKLKLLFQKFWIFLPLILGKSAGDWFFEIESNYRGHDKFKNKGFIYWNRTWVFSKSHHYTSQNKNVINKVFNYIENVF